MVEARIRCIGPDGKTLWRTSLYVASPPRVGELFRCQPNRQADGLGEPARVVSVEWQIRRPEKRKHPEIVVVVVCEPV